jgi:hypothetical protein
MGHYWSEMRGPDTPAETFALALRRSLSELGYEEVRFDRHTLYSCRECGCLVVWLVQHIEKCSRQQAAEINQQIDRAIELIEGLVMPIELLALLSLAQPHGVSAYTLQRALTRLVEQGEITRKTTAAQYSDTVISRVPKEEDECLPES